MGLSERRLKERYGAKHRRLRERWAKIVKAGGVVPTLRTSRFFRGSRGTSATTTTTERSTPGRSIGHVIALQLFAATADARRADGEFASGGLCVTPRERDDSSMSKSAPDHNLAALRKELDATAEIEDPTEQMLEIAAIVEEAVASLGLHPVVVGGLAVAYWASGVYLTHDIDVVMPYVPDLDSRMSSLGFTRDGRMWVLPRRAVFFEAPGTRLEPNPDGFKVVETKSGRHVRVQAAEDVLLVRLQEFLVTGHSDAFQQCLWLLGVKSFDHERLAAKARALGLERAVKALEDYAERVGSTEDLPQTWELKELAQRLNRSVGEG